MMNRRDLLTAGAVAAALRPERILGANDRIGVAMIGCGGRGLLSEVLQFTRETNAAVVAVCDTWRQHREKAIDDVKNAGGQAPEAFLRWEDVLAAKNVDAVVIGTPDHQHCTQLAAAMRAGKDAYVEKPLAMTMKELNAAFDAVKKSGRVVQVGTQVRSWPAPVGARQFVQSGSLGKIFKIEQSRNGLRPYWHSMGSRPVAAEDVDWKAFLMNRKPRPFTPQQYAGWYGFRDFTAGPQSNLGVHFFDLLHFITGAKHPERGMMAGGRYRYKDEYDVPDSVEVLFEYPQEGFLVRYNTTFGTNASNHIRFFGENGMLDGTRWDQPWVFTPQRGTPEPVPVAESTHHMKNYLECVRSRKEPAAPIEAGYGHSISAILADESWVRGSRMVYDPVKRAVKEG